MAMNFLDLIGSKSKKGSIHNFVNYSRVPVEVVLEEAQALIFQNLRIREMRASTTIALSIGDYTKAMPTSLLEPIAMQDREGLNLIPDRYISEGDMLRRRTFTSNVLDSGCPTHVAVYDELFQFDCKADAARTFDLVYFGKPTLLSAANATNFLTVRYPHIVRIACQAGAASFMKDSEEFKLREAELIGWCEKANDESDLGKAA